MMKAVLVMVLLLVVGCSSSSKSSSSQTVTTTTTASNAITNGATTTTVAPPQDVQPDQLAIGDCFNLPAGDNPDVSGLSSGQTTTSLPNISTVSKVDCSVAHDGEVIGITQSASGGANAAFPGTSVVAQETQQLCSNTFQGYDGIPIQQSSLTVYVLYPTQGSWSSGDRTEICSITPKDNSKLTGSVKGKRE